MKYWKNQQWIEIAEDDLRLTKDTFTISSNIPHYLTKILKEIK